MSPRPTTSSTRTRNLEFAIAAGISETAKLGVLLDVDWDAVLPFRLFPHEYW